MEKKKDDKIVYNPDTDYLLLNSDNGVRKFIRDEIVLFSDVITKRNKYGMDQYRNILITEKALYNLEKKDLKRRIEVSTIKGISITKDNDEFVVHCNDLEYDYQFISSKKKKILQFIDIAYLNINQRNVPLFVLNVKTLDNYVTSKSEKKKDITASRMPESGFITVHDYISGKVFGGTITLKKSLSKETKLDDYKILQMIGKGTHSKVFLAEYTNSNQENQYFALKCIRKDYIVKYDLVEAVKSELSIMKNIDNPFIMYAFDFFQTDKRIYFVMPFMNGGDLYQYLKERPISYEQ